MLALFAAAAAADERLADTFYVEALSAFRAGDYQRAQQRAQRAIDAYRSQGGAQVAAGEMHYLLGRAALLRALPAHGSARGQLARQALAALLASERLAPTLTHLDRTLAPQQDRERNRSLMQARRLVAGERLLLVHKSGEGTIESQDGALRCGSGCAQLDRELPLDQRVSLSARPGEHAIFAGWEGACRGTGPCQLTLDDDRTVTARFLLRWPLLVERRGGPGEVVSAPPGWRCAGSCSTRLTEGVPMQLRARARGGASFQGWGGDCVGTGPCMLTLSRPAHVVARFRPLWARPWPWLAAGAAVGLVSGLLVGYHPWDKDPAVIRDVPTR